MKAQLASGLLILYVWSLAAACQPQNLNQGNNWIISSIRNAIPSRSVIEERVQSAFSRNSLNEAYSVILPSTPEPLICRTTNDDVFDEGACLRVADCMYYGGVSYGSCAGGIGSCCVYEKRCGETSTAFMTHFTNPRHPTPSAGFGECKLSVSPMHGNICQFRIDFTQLDITGPDENSECVTDTFGVTGGSAIPRLCGDLTGQHIYVDVKPGGSSIEISIDTAKGGPQTRIWKISVIQIACDSPSRVPPGCMQFYNGTSGTVTSLNFKGELPRDGTTRQLQNHNYGICVNSLVGYCEINWTPTEGRYSFSIEGDSNRDFSQTQSLMGIGNCTRDYITIPGGEFVDNQGLGHPAERFCGSRFPTKVRTNNRPFVLYVHTDDKEELDKRNTGFSLDFRHSLCG